MPDWRPRMTLAPTSSGALDGEGRGYPRPQLRRGTWFSLNGVWEFALDPDGLWHSAADVAWTGRIKVPFAPEAPASGIGHTGFFRACWYRRRCELPPIADGERVLLHFGALDWRATV